MPLVNRSWDPGDLNDYTFFGRSWDDYQPYEDFDPDYEIKYQEWLSDDNADAWSKPERGSIVDPLGEDTRYDEFTVETLRTLQGFGRGIVSIAMNELDISDIDDQESFDEVINWLGENYGDLSGRKPTDIEKYEPTPYEPKALEIPEELLNTIPEEAELNPSSMTIGSAPQVTNQLAITGFKR